MVLKHERGERAPDERPKRCLPKSSLTRRSLAVAIACILAARVAPASSREPARLIVCDTIACSDASVFLQTVAELPSQKGAVTLRLPSRGDILCDAVMDTACRLCVTRLAPDLNPFELSGRRDQSILGFKEGSVFHGLIDRLDLQKAILGMDRFPQSSSVRGSLGVRPHMDLHSAERSVLPWTKSMVHMPSLPASRPKRRLCSLASSSAVRSATSLSRSALRRSIAASSSSSSVTSCETQRRR